MTGSTEQCPQGWDPSELLAYLEGDLPPDRRKELEQHLALCIACSSKIESLRQWDGMLRACPQCFHPDDDDLFRFVSRAEDAEGRISKHLETCEECKEAVAILREMLAVGPQLSGPPQPLPGVLLKTLEERHSAGRAVPQPTSRFALLLEWLRRPFSAPMLAAGTVAAALIVAALLIPIWTGFKVDRLVLKGAVPIPEKAPVPPVETGDATVRGQPPVSHYRAKPVEPQVMQEGALPAAKRVPELPTVPAPPPAPTAPALEGAEPMKKKEGLGEGLVTPKPSAPAGSEIVAPGRGSLAVRERRSEFRAQGAPPLKDLPVQSARPLQKERDAYAKPKVLVRIVLPDSQEFQGLRFFPSKKMEGRYFFLEKKLEKKTEKEMEEVRRQDRRSPEAAIRTGEGPSYIVTVTVSPKGAVYGLEGSLSKPGTTIQSKTLSKDNIPRENLQLEITSMVTALLPGH